MSKAPNQKYYSLRSGLQSPTHHDPVKNNSATYKVNLKDSALDYPETPDGVYVKSRIACLELKGWN